MLELRTFGGLELRTVAGEQVEPLSGRTKCLALLAYLAAEAPEGHVPREEVAALLWSGRTDERASTSLRGALSQIRRATDPAPIGDKGESTLRLAREHLRADVIAFRDAVAAGDHARALELYAGDFLAGVQMKGARPFRRWADERREAFRREAYEAALLLGTSRREAGDLAAAEAAFRTALELAPLREEAAENLIRTLADRGRAAEAIQFFEAFRKRRLEELELAPSEELERRIAAIRAAPPGPPGSGGKDGGRRPGGPAAPSSPPGGRRRRALLGGLGALVLLAAVGVGVWHLLGVSGEATPRAGERSVAVLPFEAIGTDEPGPIAEGLHSDLITRLSRMSGLDVISATSVARFRDARLPLPAVADSLGVKWVVEGDVQRAGEAIRVNVQLIDPSTDLHAWADTYRRELSAENLFDLQEEITREIAGALEAELAGSEGRPMGGRPTGDLEAYEYFLRGRTYQSRAPRGIDDTRESHRLALRMFDRAVERDSGFAEAWARKAQAHLALWGLSAGEAEDELARAREAAERARAVDPEGPWGHLALAEVHRRGDRDLERALEHYEATGLNSPEVLLGKAKVRQEQGRLREAIVLYERARRLDPGNYELAFQSWWAYGLFRRYDEAAKVLDRVLELAPDHRAARYHRLRLPLLESGDAAAVEAPASADPEVAWRLGEHRKALSGEHFLENTPLKSGLQATRGLILTELGDSTAARASFDSARVELEAQVREDSSAVWLNTLAIVYAGLGRREAALEVAQRAVEEARGPLQISISRLNLALVQTLVGEEGAAVATLEEYLSNPGLYSFRSLATHPVLSRLEDHPRFGELEERFGG